MYSPLQCVITNGQPANRNGHDHYSNCIIGTVSINNNKNNNL